MRSSPGSPAQAFRCPTGPRRAAADALGRLVEAFERRHGGDEARRAAAWSLARARASSGDRARLATRALRLDPALPIDGLRRLRARNEARSEQVAARSWLRAGMDAPVDVTFVLPEPAPYRTAMLDRAADRPELELTAIYAGSSVQRRAWARTRDTARSSSTAGAFPARTASSATTILSRSTSSARSRTPLPRSSSSRAGARSPRRRRLPGAGDTTFRTCSSSSRTSATPARAGGARSRERSSRRRYETPRMSSSWERSRGVDARARRRSRIASRSSPTRSTPTGSGRRPIGCALDGKELRAEAGLGPEDVAVLSVARSRRRKATTR